MDLSRYSDEELERIAQQAALDQIPDEELERIAARAVPKSRSWGDELASLASQAIPGASLFAPPATGLTAQFQQGLTMGWGDELNALRAGAGALVSGGGFAPQRTVAGLISGRQGGGSSATEAYDASMAQQQAEREAYERSNPGRAFVAEMAGGVLGAGKVGSGVAAGKSALQALPRIAATGAAAGAVAGAGSADPGERTSGAVTGGMLGAAAGPLLQGAARVGRDGYSLVRNALGLNRGAADEAVVNALARDGRTVQEMRQALQNAPEGVPVSAADVASPGVQSVLSGAAVSPGKAQQVVTETLESRLGDQGQRVREAVQQAAGPREYAVNLTEEVKASRWAKAAPLYDEAFKSGRVGGERVAAILQDQDVSRAYGVAQKIAQREGVALQPLDAPDLRTLDYLKRGLDGEIAQGFRSDNAANAASLKKLRNELVSIMDAQSPAYREARKVYAGDSEVLEAIELGRRALNMGDGPLQMALKSMGGAEKDAFRKAALDALSDKLSTSEGAKTINDLIGSEKARRNLRLIVGDEKAYTELTKRLLAEQQIRRTGQRINPRVGSPTAMRQGDAGALPETMLMGQSAATGNWFGLAQQALNALRQRGQGLSDKAKGRMASDLLSDDPAVQQAYLQRLEEASGRMQRQRARRGFLGASAAGGSTAGLLSN